MKRVLAYTLAVFAALFVFGRDTVESTKVYFSINRSKFESSLVDNAAAMDSLISNIRNAADSQSLINISIESYASPDGSYSLNEKLAARRGDSISNYIINHTGISPDFITTLPGVFAWDELRHLVYITPQVPSRNKVLEILDDYKRMTTSPEKDAQNIGGGNYQLLTKQRLISLSGGKPYRWMLRHLFPYMRYAHVAVTRQQSDNIIDSIIVEPIDPPTPPEPCVDVTDTVPQIDPDTLPPTSATHHPVAADNTDECLHQRLALKTNLLYYAALMPNIELEYLINDHWTTAINWDIAWWGDYSRNKSYRMSIISAEAKYWISPRAPWHGLHVGAFIGSGWYDLQNGGNGKHGDGFMSGLSIGYMWSISRNLSFESSIGAGYLYTRYKVYRPYEGHHLYMQTKTLNYFGPLKLKFSIVWRFLNDCNKKQKTPVL